MALQNDSFLQPAAFFISFHRPFVPIPSSTLLTFSALLTFSYPPQVHPDYPELQRRSGKVVQSIQSFKDDLNLAGPVMDNITRASYEKPTPVQKHALPIGEL
jgi:hypothetical protein